MGKILSSISLIALTIINYLQVGKFKQRGVSVPSTLKVVPVAVMLAMSSMVAQAQTHKTLTPKEAFELAASSKVLGKIRFKNASITYGDCIIKYFDTDNNPNTVDFAELEFFNDISPIDYAYAKIYPEKFVEDKNGFWVEGNGDKDVILNGHIIRKEKARIAIPIEEEFFNALLKIYGDELPIIRNTQKKYIKDIENVNIYNVLFPL